jgi:hypothetical protein
LIPSGSENTGQKMVEEMIQAESGSMITTSVTGFELHEVDRTRGESKERSPDGELGKYSFLFCVHYTNNSTVFALTSKYLVLPTGFRLSKQN